jgi:hypothetical protein
MVQRSQWLLVLEGSAREYDNCRVVYVFFTFCYMIVLSTV